MMDTVFVRDEIEPLLINRFGEDVIEEIFNSYKFVLIDWISKERTKLINITISLTRKA